MKNILETLSSVVDILFTIWVIVTFSALRRRIEELEEELEGYTEETGKHEETKE